MNKDGGAPKELTVDCFATREGIGMTKYELSSAPRHSGSNFPALRIGLVTPARLVFRAIGRDTDEAVLCSVASSQVTAQASFEKNEPRNDKPDSSNPEKLL